MKEIVTLIMLLSVLSCNNSTENKKPVSDTSRKAMSPIATTPKKDFSSLHFDNKKDPICGMPVRIGIEDTCHYKGKIYAFCSDGCKEEYLKNPKAYVVK